MTDETVNSGNTRGFLNETENGHEGPHQVPSSRRANSTTKQNASIVNATASKRNLNKEVLDCF